VNRNVPAVPDVHLIRYDAMRPAIAACHRVDEVKEIRDKSQALIAYAKQAKDKEMIAWVSEIKVRAERKAGELTREMPKAKPSGSNQHKERSHDATDPPTLADVGISKDQSSYTAIAATSERA